MTRSPRGAGWRTRVRTVLVVVGALAIVGASSQFVLLRYASARLSTTSLPALDAREPAPAAAGGPATAEATDVLVVALDSDEPGGALVTDMVVLVQVRAGQARPVVLALPTDLKVEVPGRGDHRLAEVHGLGGPDLLVRVVEDYTGIQLDHYAQVAIPAVMAMVDRLGGVPVCLQQPIEDATVGASLPAGCAVLDGAASAAFLRARSVGDEFGAPDVFGRMVRQQYLLGQLLGQATSTRAVLDPFRRKAVIDGATGAVLVDDAVGARQLLGLGRVLRDVPAAAVDRRVVPSWYSSETGYAHAYPEATAELLQALRQGVDLPDDIGVAAPEQLEAGDVRVVVLNGEGTAGLATEVADRLTAAGFAVVGTDNFDGFGVERSRILTTAANEPRARLLAAIVPGAEVVVVERLGFDGVHVVLVVGADRAATDAAPTAAPTEVEG